MRTWPFQALIVIMTTIMMITTIRTISEKGKESLDKEVSIFRLSLLTPHEGKVRSENLFQRNNEE